MIYLPYKPGARVRVSSAFGYRIDPISGATGSWHGGLDLVGQDSKYICAPCDGEVVVSQIITDRSNLTWQWGNYICIRSDELEVFIYMCHMSERYVEAGQRVRAGDIIGLEGSTGYSTGSHCHFEIRDFGNKQINPADILGIDNEAGYVWENPADYADDTQEVKDNTPDVWAEGDVEFAAENGILFGDENGDYKLHSECTRQEMLVFLYRLYKYMTE